jgi:hypothetical protein
MGALR